jgi:hypothetical protein
MPVETPEEASQLTKRWMEDREFLIADKTTEGTYFLFEGSYGDGLNFTIQQPKKMKRVIGVLLIMEFAPKHLGAISSMPSQERDEFFWNLTKDLMFVPPSVSFEPDDKNPKSVFIIKEISYDELTEGRLGEAVDQVNRAIIWVISSLNKRFGEPEEE